VTVADRTHYEVIDAEPTAAKADLKAAYVAALEAAQVAEDADESAAVRRAWQVLSDPIQRQRYDESIGVHHRGALESVDVVDGEIVDDDVGADDDPDVEVVDDEDGDVGASRQRLFHQIPDFLEQPTLGRRVTASLIDVVTTLAVFLVSITITYQITGASEGLPGVLTFMGWAEFWILVLFLIPTYRTGQTLGKRMTYVMTVDRETGNLPSIGQIIRRYMVPMVAIPALFQMGAFLALFFGLSYAMGRDQLSLADRLAKTVVVVARYKPTRSGQPA
jgi:uncharacterized RDD family membrane protein YckC